MNISGTHDFPHSREEVFGMFLDPAVLQRSMPGCERLEAVADDRFELSFVVPVPAVKGSYAGTVDVVEKDPPHSLRMRIDAKGKNGFVSADARMRLEPNGSGTTVHYDADAQVGGPVAAVGQRVLGAITRRQLVEMMSTMERSRPAPGPPEEVAARRPGFFARAWQGLLRRLGRG
jgi:carbon monoxide dehydrogenase subunit G